MELFLHEFQGSALPLNKQTLFDTAVFYGKTKDVEYLLRNFRREINPFSNNFFAIRMAFRLRNIEMMNKIISLVGPPPAIPMNLIEKVPPMIVYVLPQMRKTKQLSKEIALKFLNISLMHNDRILLQCLINNDIEEFISDYRFLVVACGANRIDIIQQQNYFALISDLSDECIETSYLCQSMDVLKFLVEKFQITNPFLKERVRNEFVKRNFQIDNKLYD
jgi:hypothetical protein